MGSPLGIVPYSLDPRSGATVRKNSQKRQQNFVASRTGGSIFLKFSTGVDSAKKCSLKFQKIAEKKLVSKKGWAPPHNLKLR